jgi:hypothetical protein
MGDTTTTRTTSPAPRLSQPGDAPITEQQEPCGACGHPDTRCVFHRSAGSIIGWWVEAEYHCPACGMFTQVELAYES